MEITHEHIYKVLKDKFNMVEVNLSGDESSFVATSIDGTVKTRKDVTAKELSDAKSAIINEINLQATKAEADKTALLSKLGITADELQTLLG